MTSVFPAALDNANAAKANATPQVSDHPAHHNLLADAVNQLEKGAVKVFTALQYNAVGDDTADDATALQNAATAAAGAILVLNPGYTFKVNTRLVLPANTTLIGYGATLHGPLACRGANQRVLGLKVTCADPGDVLPTIGVVDVTGSTNCRLEGCDFTYTGTQSTADVGILESINGSLTGLQVIGCSFTCSANGRANGIKLVLSDPQTITNVRIERCTFSTIGRMGLEFLSQNSAHPGIADVVIADCRIRATGANSGAAGQGISIAGLTDGFRVVGNHFEAIPGVALEVVNGCRGSAFTGNTFKDCTTTDAVNTGGSGSYLTFTGNTFQNTARAYVAALDRSTVEGNAMDNNLFYFSNCTRLVVTGNDVLSPGTGALIVEACDTCTFTGNRVQATSGAASGAVWLTSATANCRFVGNSTATAGGVQYYVSGAGAGNVIVGGTTTPAVNGVLELTLTDFATYTPTFTGFSVAPTVYAGYVQVGKMVTVWLRTNAIGTSNATTFTMTLPVTADVSALGAAPFVGLGACSDGSAAQATPATAYISDSTHVGFEKTHAAAAWTNTGTKDWNGVFTYKAA